MPDGRAKDFTITVVTPTFQRPVEVVHLACVELELVECESELFLAHRAGCLGGLQQVPRLVGGEFHRSVQELFRFCVEPTHSLPLRSRRTCV